MCIRKWYYISNWWFRTPIIHWYPDNLDTWCKRRKECIGTCFYTDYIKKPKRYFPATNITQTQSMPLIYLTGTYFWVRATRYMPKKPPTPNKIPKPQSGATEILGKNWAKIWYEPKRQYKRFNLYTTWTNQRGQVFILHNVLNIYQEWRPDPFVLRNSVPGSCPADLRREGLN